MSGAVVFLGVSAKRLLDPYNPPKGTAGPFVVSGNNRYSFLLLISCRRIICLELIKEGHPDSATRLRRFWMNVYCFPEPDEPAQRLIIRQIGSQENEMQATFIKMSDADKLVTCRRNMNDFAAGMVGDKLEKHMGQVLGLIKVGKQDPQGTVKTMYIR
jgi:hypothetical protein